MNTESNKAPFVLIFHHPNEGGCHGKGDSEVFRQTMAWMEGLKAKGLLRGGMPLGDAGRVLRSRSQPPVDGPFIEGKEIIGGHIVVLARDLDEACAIAEGCPGIDNGTTVEVRPALSLPAPHDRLLG